MRDVSNFHADLAWSHQQADQPFWEQVYKQAFGDYLAMVEVREDGWAQRGGIDRIIVLADGSQVTIDEKVRRKDYGDILLERWSNVERKVPGWVQKELTCDYIAYASLPSQTCYLLPFRLLRRAWAMNGREWIEQYGTIRAKNQGYESESVPVPVDVLLDAMAQTMRVTWNAQAA